MTILIILALIFLGIVLLLLEFAVIPGFTVFGVGGILLLGYSVYLAFIHYGSWAGIILLLFLITIIPVLFFKFLKSKAGKKMQLETVIDGKANALELDKIHVGDTGIAIGRLAPMGKIEINKMVVEGKSAGGYIPEGSTIEVIKINDNQIIVKQKL
jgi:membrane-bound ClpP family serine protease